MHSQGEKITYDPESNVLSWELAEGPITYAREIGNVVFHFSDSHLPVLIEVLEASKLLPQADKLFAKQGKRVISGTEPAAG